MPEEVPPQPPRPHQLGYASPDPERPAGGVRYAGQMALGFVAFVGAVFAGVMSTVGIGPVGMLDALVIALTVFGTSLAVVTYHAHASWRWRGFGIGVLIGLGLFLLAAGVCVSIAFAQEPPWT